MGYHHPGVKIGEGYTDFSQGPIKNTENTFDLALSDAGFFAVSYTNKEERLPPSIPGTAALP